MSKSQAYKQIYWLKSLWNKLLYQICGVSANTLSQPLRELTPQFSILNITMTLRRRGGFTLIEIILVIGILGLLLAITLVAINPGKQFSQANNTKRRNDVIAILNAIQQYTIDNKGVLPSSITTTTQTIQKTSGVDLCGLLVPTYIASLPVDPLTNSGTPVTNCSSSYTTNYTISRSTTNNRLTISAPNAELSATISVNQ